MFTQRHFTQKGQWLGLPERDSTNWEDTRKKSARGSEGEQMRQQSAEGPMCDPQTHHFISSPGQLFEVDVI